MKKISLLLFVMLFIASGAIAQEEMKPTKYENVSWHKVVLVDYKPGKMKRAKEIIKLYQESGKAAETMAPEMIWFMSGEYDLMLIWTLKDGPSEFEWKYSPDGLKWWNEFIKQIGSKEEAEKIQAEYTDLIFSYTSYLARKDL